MHLSEVRTAKARPIAALDLGRLPTLPIAEASAATRRTIADEVALHATKTPHKTAFDFCGDGENPSASFTFAELDARATRLASELQSRNLVSERALLLYPAGLDYIVALLACWRAGVVAVPAFPPHRNRHSARIAAIIADATPAAMLTTANLASAAQQLCESKLTKSQVIATDQLVGNTVAQTVDETTEPLALLQYTSGSTGDPKGVCISHANLLANAHTIKDAFPVTPDSRAVSWLPLYHDMGLVGSVVVPLVAGSPTTLLSPNHFLQQPLRWLKLISELKAEIAGGPNFAYDLCVSKTTSAERAALDLSSWRVAFNGAEPVKAATLDSFSTAFATSGFNATSFYPCYGLAEATLLVSGGDSNCRPRKLRHENSPAPLVSCGRPRGLDALAIVDPVSRRRVAEGQVGEIWVSGDNVSSGYWNRADSESFAAQIRGEQETYLRTGDLGVLHRGELFVTGRAKEVLIIRGVNYHPHDIEQTSRTSHPALEKAAAAAINGGDQTSERLVVLQESPRRYLQNSDDIIAAIRLAIIEHHGIVPKAVLLVKPGELSRTTSGKIQRFACRDAYAGGRLNSIAQWRDGNASGRQTPAHDHRDTARALIDIVRDTIPLAAGCVDRDTQISSLGLDSLQAMELASAIETRFEKQIDETALATCQTIADLIAQIDGVEPSPATAIEINAGDWQFDKSPEYRQLQKSLQITEKSGIANPYFMSHDGIAADRTRIAGREFINFCSYNYLGLNGHPVVTAAAQSAIAQYGTSVSASRLVAGERPVHRQLERALADTVGAEDAITFVGGHSTNETVIGHMFGPGDLVLHDALAHNSIVQGCRLSGAHRRAFPHNDPSACSKILASVRHQYRRVLVAIEGVYSMDGDIAPLPEFIAIKKEHRAYLMVDEAHSLGTLGRTGRGIGEHFAVDPRDVDLWMGTLSKSLASCGGYIAASAAIVQYLKYTAPGFVYSVGLSPPNAAAALAALSQVGKSRGSVMLLQANSKRFLDGVKRIGLNTGMSDGTPVVPVITGDSVAALHLSDRLFRGGVNVQPILAPAVEERAARLRFFITSLHTSEQIDRTLELLAQAAIDLPRSAA